MGIEVQAGGDRDPSAENRSWSVRRGQRSEEKCGGSRGQRGEEITSSLAGNCTDVSARNRDPWGG